MTQWVRLLSRVTGSSAEWHVPRSKSFTTFTYCGTKLEGSLEVTSDEKAEREGRCSSCVTYLATTLEIIPQRPSPLIAHSSTTSVTRAAAKKTAAKKTAAKKTAAKKTAAKKTAAKKTIRKSVPKGRSARAPVAKRPVRRSRRGR